MDSIKDIYGHIMDRVQKLTSALYRVTDLLSDKEPLKWTLRDSAVGLHNALVSVKFIKDKNDALQESLDRAHQIIKSLELVSAGTCVSNLNFEILKREYLYIKNLLEGKKSDLVFDRKLLPEFGERQKKIREPKLAEKENRLPADGGQVLPAGGIANGAVNIAGKIIAEAEENTMFAGVAANPINPQSRKGKIIDFLKDKEAVSVGEIASIFDGGASDKAIQRDLFDLVKLGKILAIGDKRWRKYELI